MVYSKTQVGGSLAVAAVVAIVAVQAFGLPLGMLLMIGLILCFPLVVLGRHGRGGDRDRESAAATGSEWKRASRPGNG